MTRIFATIAVVVLVFGSLITFPAYIHWMVSIWLALALVACFRSRPMWRWLVPCLIILLIKQPGYTLEFWVFIFLVAGVSWIDWRTVRKQNEPTNSNRLVSLAIVLVSATVIYATARGYSTNTSRRLATDGRPIACLGDSLTDFGYPQELGKLIVAPIADFGVNGITTDAGIKMIPDILATDPQLVVIELGGHDYNADRKTRAETKANLVRLVDAFRERDIEVVLVEIPRGFITDPYSGLEREISATYDLQMVDDRVIRSFVFNSPILPPGMWLDPSKRYSDDGLHPNELGNKHFARIVCQAIVKLYGDSILR